MCHCVKILIKLFYDVTIELATKKRTTQQNTLTNNNNSVEILGDLYFNWFYYYYFKMHAHIIHTNIDMEN